MLWLWQVFEYAFSSKYARAWNKSRLWICEGCKGCLIYLNKPEYALIMPQYAWICFNDAEYAWICLHIPEQKEFLICPNFECAWYSTPNIWGHCRN